MIQNYDIKIKFNSDHDLPLNKLFKLCDMNFVARSVFMNATDITHKLSYMNVCINF